MRAEPGGAEGMVAANNATVIPHCKSNTGSFYIHISNYSFHSRKIADSNSDVFFGFPPKTKRGLSACKQGRNKSLGRSMY